MSIKIKLFLYSSFLFLAICGVHFKSNAREPDQIFRYHPNPYQVLFNSINHKNAFEAKTLNSLLKYFALNCRDGVVKQKSNNKFCTNKKLFKEIENIENKIKISKEEQRTVWGDDIYILSSLFSTNFEMDVLLSENEVKEEYEWIKEYIFVQNKLSEGLLEFSSDFFGTHPGVDIIGRSTIIPTYYALKNSASSLEAIVRFLKTAECLPAHKMCNFYLWSLSQDYKKMIEAYKKLVFEPLDKIKTFVLSGNYGNFSLTEERQWVKETYQSLIQREYDFLYEKLLTSAGHVDDFEHKFKTNLVKIYQIKNAVENFESFIDLKSQKWRNNSEVIFQQLKLDPNLIPYKEDILTHLMNEIKVHKETVIDHILWLDEEVENADFKTNITS